jgi:hypothetical protein
MTTVLPAAWMTDEEARAQFVALALSVEGLGAAAATRVAYLDLLACSPDETPAMREAMAEMSSCALTIRGLWWRASCRHAILAAPYVVGHAVSDLITIAHDYGALRPRTYAPRPGDVVYIDNPGHVLTVIAVDGATVTSIDGGQRDAAHLECITRRTRTLAGTTLGGRPIVSVVDCVALAQSESW